MNATTDFIGNAQLFPVLANWAFFNHAGVCPLPRPAADAMRKFCDQAEAAGYLRADWDHGQPTDLISAERDVFGDGKVVLIPLPGHTPGTMGAAVHLDRDGSFLLVSDAVSLRENLDTDTVPRNTWNAEALLKSFEEIRRIEKSGATVICGHDAAQWQSLRKGVEAYE